MENIEVGQIVFHKRPMFPEFMGPGTVIKITHDALIGVDAYTVVWQSSSYTFDHYRSSLLTLAEKEMGNVG